MIQLQWHNTDPAKAEEVRDQTTEDLSRLMEDLGGTPSKLIFHHVFLTGDTDGPCVFVWGELDSDAFHCEYCEKMDWRTGEELDDEKNPSTDAVDDAKI